MPDASVSCFLSHFILSDGASAARHDIVAVEQSCQLVFCIWIQHLSPFMKFYSFPILYRTPKDATSRRHPSRRRTLLRLSPTVYTTNLPPKPFERVGPRGGHRIESNHRINRPTKVASNDGQSIKSSRRRCIWDPGKFWWRQVVKLAVAAITGRPCLHFLPFCVALDERTFDMIMPTSCVCMTPLPLSYQLPCHGAPSPAHIRIPQVNGFHPQLTAVSNPVQPNDIPPPSWPSYVPTVTSRRLEEKRNRQRGSSGSPTTSPSAATTNDEASAAAPITSEIDARTAIVVRRLQNDAKETDRSRSKMLRKRVRREERNERRHMRKRLRRHQGNQQGRRTSETTEVSFSSMSSSFSTSTRTDATTTSTTTGSSASSVATTSYGTMRASHVSSSSSTAQAATPLATEPPTTTSSESEGYGTQPISSRVEAAPIPSVDDEMHFSELYSDVFMTSNRPQFLATLGGRLVACEFTRALCASQFDLDILLLLYLHCANVLLTPLVHFFSSLAFFWFQPSQGMKNSWQ